MGVVFSAPVLPLDVATLAAALESAGKLEWLMTRWCFSASERRWARKLPLPETWLRRSVAPVGMARLQRLPGADMRQHFDRWLGRDGFHSLDKSFQMVDQAAAALVRPQTSAIMGREDACLACFRRGKEFNIPRIYQLPTAHCATVERLLRRELDSFPEAINSREVEADFAPERMGRKAAELSSATHVLCPSSFVHQSLKAAGVEEARITVLPLGADLSFAADWAGTREPIFLYAGTISARKGVHRLIRTWKQLRAYRTHRLRLIGDLRLPDSFVGEYRGVFEHIPRIQRKSLVREYAKAQAFVFNAIADGFGQVLTEAMACGTPVLASRNSGAPDLIDNGEEGWLYEYGDDEAMAAALDKGLSSPEQLLRMGQCGRRRVLQWTCDDFANAFLKWINPIIEPGSPVRAAEAA